MKNKVTAGAERKATSMRYAALLSMKIECWEAKMDFSFNERQLALREKVRAFALAEIEPIAEEMDEKGAFDAELLRKLHKEGYMNVPYDSKYGGGDGDYIDYAIVVEEISRVDASAGITLSVQTSLYGSCVENFGTEEQ